MKNLLVVMVNIVLRLFSRKKSNSKDSLSPAKVTDALCDNFLLFEKYTITGAIHRTKNNIFYLAIDTETNKSVIIKEFFPSDMVSRGSGIDINLDNPENAAKFSAKLASFISKNSIVSEIANTAGIIGDKDFFEENGTAYFVTNSLDENDLEEDDDVYSSVESISNVGNSAVSSVASGGADMNSLTLAINNAFTNNSLVIGETFANATAAVGCGTVLLLTLPAASVPFDVNPTPRDIMVSADTSTSTETTSSYYESVETTIADTIAQITATTAPETTTEEVSTAETLVDESTIIETTIVETTTEEITTIVESTTTETTTIGETTTDEITTAGWEIPEDIDTEETSTYTTVELEIPDYTGAGNDSPEIDTVSISIQDFDEENIMTDISEMMDELIQYT